MVAAILVVENVRGEEGPSHRRAAGEPQRLHLHRTARRLSHTGSRSRRRTERAGSVSECDSPIPSTNGLIPTCRCTALRASPWSGGRRATSTAITLAEPTGRFTERVGHAVTQLIEKEGATLVLDMHEAYPEYPIINMIVAHQRAFEIGTIAALTLQSRGIPMDIMASPENLHGLSHREFGDHTAAFALLSETASAAMGRFRGRTDTALIDRWNRPELRDRAWTRPSVRTVHADRPPAERARGAQHGDDRRNRRRLQRNQSRKGDRAGEPARLRCRDGERHRRVSQAVAARLIK